MLSRSIQQTWSTDQPAPDQLTIPLNKLPCYFASLSGAIAFGGLLGEKTGNLIGISETLVLSSLAALIFALFSGSPLIITGVTGPLLLYDESLFGICSENNVDYLAIRQEPMNQRTVAKISKRNGKFYKPS